MTDRSARDRLAALIEEFLAEDIAAFEFDERISVVADETDDETVQEVSDLLWNHYDDLKDHKANLSREEWDYFQRLLLLLHSNAVLKTERYSEWTWRQARWLLELVVFVAGVILLGIRWQLLMVTVPLGVLSAVSRWMVQSAEDPEDDEFVRLTPYSSVPEMLAVRRSVPAFRKRRYPNGTQHRPIRSPVDEGFMWLQTGLLCLTFWPLVLMFQTLPRSRRSTRVVPA